MSSTRRTLLESPKGPLHTPGSRNDYAVLSPDEPALNVMTDFRTGPVITTPASTSIEVALRQMELSDAHFTFVVDDDGALVGSVTSYDIRGEKPMRYMQSIGCSHRSCAWRDVMMENIMEPVAEWLVLDRADVARLSVGDVAELMSESNRRYLVVVERMKHGPSWQVRGLFSSARIQLLRGTAAPGVAPAQTFAELEREIA